MKKTLVYLIILNLSIAACANNDNETEEVDPPTPPITDTKAVVRNVSVTGEEGSYTFSVQIKSPDEGCNQYADWWEVFTEDGTLIYRRILAHSHVNEQPFTRSGGPVNINKEEVVYIRAHMNNQGYGDQVYKGSVANGFIQETLATSFASELETTAPLPNGCAF